MVYISKNTKAEFNLDLKEAIEEEKPKLNQKKQILSLSRVISQFEFIN